MIADLMSDDSWNRTKAVVIAIELLFYRVSKNQIIWSAAGVVDPLL
jgi:hypothetical protein